MAINLYSKASVDSLLSPKLSISSLSNAAATTLNATAPTTNQVLSYDGTELKWATVSGGGGAAWGGITGTLSSQTDLQNALDLKAPLASPTLTGTPLSTTAAADTNTTQIATTAFVVGQASSTTPASNGTAAVGTSLKYARADHVHANVLPTGGTTGQVLSKVDGTNYNVQWSTAGGGGGGGVDIQTFSTAGTTTWTKPAGAKWVVGYMFGAGGGGGSGAKNATTAIRSGGAGGAGGGMLRFSIDASLLSASESVVIGAGGLGGASQTIDSTAGIAGSQGGTTSFAGRYRAYYAIAGAAGSLTGVAGGAGGSAAGYDGVCFQVSAVNPGGNGNTGAGGNASFNYVGYYAPSGGGGGAGQAATSIVARFGGNGGTKTNASGSGQVGMVATIAGGAGGTVAGVSPTNGADGSIAYGGGTGGGGGAYLTGVAGMNGSNGGTFGGGGGGGSAADNGTTGSGAGGNGGAGALVLITFLG